MPQELSSPDWPKAIETIGIIGSLWLGIRAARKDSEDRQLSNLQSMAARGDALWEKVYEDPKLKRVVDEKAELSVPPTLAELGALNKIFKLFQDGWRVASATDRDELEYLGRDIADFLRRPLPRAVWEKEKVFKNRKFVKFVEQGIEAAGRL